MLRRFWMSAVLIAAATTAAMAGDATGEWTRADGKGKVRFAPCGAALCGTVTWLRAESGAAKVGQRVFFDMKPDGDNVWTGKALNPEDGKEYSGKMTLDGDTLTTAGCKFGGMMCKSSQWTRAR